MNFTRRLCVLLALALLAITGCQKPQPIDPAKYNAADWEKRITEPSLKEEEFTELYALAATAEFKGATVLVTGKGEVTVKFDDGGELKASLGNAWTEAANDPTHRAQICRHYLSVLSTSMNNRGDARQAVNASNIVAVIRSDQYLAQAEKQAGSTTNGFVSERLVADLNIVYATDREGLIAYLMESDRSRLGIDFASMRGLALTNLQRILPEIKIHGPGPLFAIEADGTYESSMLLADEFWSDQASVVKGDIVAAVPSRDVLVFTGSASPDGLKKLRQLVAAVHEGGDHLISKTILVRRNGRWEKFSD